MGRRAIFAAVLVGLSCLTGMADAEPSDYANYLCGDGRKITLIFEHAGTALVMVDGGALRLPRQVQGFRYASPAGAVYGKVGVVTFEMAGRPLTSCRLVERGRT